MRIMRSIPAAIAACAMIAAPVASAQASQTMSREDAMLQMQQNCADAARRTDEAGRNWHATYCTPTAMARYGSPALGTGATIGGLGFLLGVIVLGIFVRG